MIVLAQEESTELLNATLGCSDRPGWYPNSATYYSSICKSRFIYQKKKSEKNFLSVFHMASIVKGIEKLSYEKK